MNGERVDSGIAAFERIEALGYIRVDIVSDEIASEHTDSRVDGSIQDSGTTANGDALVINALQSEPERLDHLCERVQVKHFSGVWVVGIVERQSAAVRVTKDEESRGRIEIAVQRGAGAVVVLDRHERRRGGGAARRCYGHAGVAGDVDDIGLDITKEHRVGPSFESLEARARDGDRLAAEVVAFGRARGGHRGERVVGVDIAEGGAAISVEEGNPDRARFGAGRHDDFDRVVVDDADPIGEKSSE